MQGRAKLITSQLCLACCQPLNRPVFPRPPGRRCDATFGRDYGRTRRKLQRDKPAWGWGPGVAVERERKRCWGQLRRSGRSGDRTLLFRPLRPAPASRRSPWLRFAALARTCDITLLPCTDIVAFQDPIHHDEPLAFCTDLARHVRRGLEARVDCPDASDIGCASFAVQLAGASPAAGRALLGGTPLCRASPSHACKGRHGAPDPRHRGSRRIRPAARRRRQRESDPEGRL